MYHGCVHLILHTLTARPGTTKRGSYNLFRAGIEPRRQISHIIYLVLVRLQNPEPLPALTYNTKDSAVRESNP